LAQEVEDVSEGPVLVVGATGRTGRRIVARLVEQGVPVRALVRDEARARETLPEGIELFVGDVRRAETLAEPVAGARAVVIAACSSGAERGNDPETVDYLGTCHLMEHATPAGVERVLFVSTIYASRPEHYQDMEPTSLGWKARAEEVIRGSGLPYSIVRPGWLTDGEGGDPLAVFQGDTAEGRISRADLAAVCAELVFLPEAAGKTFEVIASQDGQAGSLAPAVGALAPDAAAPERSR
jgi:uncharacterized protein YbjT (DUF2867 family)